MEQPRGVVDPERVRFVCLLLKGIYRLKQSARCWNEFFNQFAIQFDLIPSVADPCVYYIKGNFWIYRGDFCG